MAVWKEGYEWLCGAWGPLPWGHPPFSLNFSELHPLLVHRMQQSHAQLLSHGEQEQIHTCGGIAARGVQQTGRHTLFEIKLLEEEIDQKTLISPLMDIRKYN